MKTITLTEEEVKILNTLLKAEITAQRNIQSPYPILIKDLSKLLIKVQA